MSFFGITGRKSSRRTAAFERRQNQSGRCWRRDQVRKGKPLTSFGCTSATTHSASWTTLGMKGRRHLPPKLPRPIQQVPVHPRCPTAVDPPMEMRFAEISVLSLFLVLLSLWILRDPKAWPGFGPLFNLTDPEKPKGKGIKCVTDATSAMLIAVILFVWPSRKPDFICSKDRDHTTSPRLRDALMDWRTMQMKFPWSVVILLGGGFALAAGVNKSGLSDWVGVQLQQLSSLSPLGIQVVCVVITMAVTNVTSNTVTASIFIPIVNGLALKLGMNPLSLIIPTTLACSYAFLLPVATPPNAIVFAGGLLTVSDMIFAGTVVSIVSLGSIILFTNTFMNSILALDMFPEWALDKLTPDVLELVKARNMTMTYY